MSYRKQLCSRLSEPIAKEIMRLTAKEADMLQEIRVRRLCKTELLLGEERRKAAYIPDQDEMNDLLAALTGRSLYAYEKQMARGYLPLPGGHRVGVCGRITADENKEAHVSDVTSVCIRIAHRAEGASRTIRPFLREADGRPRRVLLLGAPGCGKTTALRDAGIWLAGACSLHVAAMDERNELFPDGGTFGAPIDVLHGRNKAEGVMQLLRTMSPEVIVTDEIGAYEDAAAIEEAARCGVGILASAHAGSLEEAMQRHMLQTIVKSGALDCIILLGKRASCLAVWERKGIKGCLRGGGCGGDGVDWNQRDGVCDGGWGKGAAAIYPGDAPQLAQNA